MFPTDILYTTTHELVRLEDGVATVGITNYAADQLSDITYVELPSVGDELAAETVLGTIESVKAAADLICPVDGQVIEVNETIVENPDLIGEDPYDDGWLVKLKSSDASQMEELMTAEDYQAFVEAESGEEEEEGEDSEEEMEDI